MEIKYIKELMAAMGRSGTKRLSLKKDDVELTLERGDFGSGRSMESLESFEDLSRNLLLSQRAGHPMKHSEIPTAVPSQNAAELPKQGVVGSYINSPMVGTFYLTPNPDEPPFVRVGDKVEKNTIIGIIEAMKVMNEIKAGLSGTVAEVLVDGGQPVEFGTKLFRII